MFLTREIEVERDFGQHYYSLKFIDDIYHCYATRYVENKTKSYASLSYHDHVTITSTNT